MSRRRKGPKRPRGERYIVIEFWELESPAFLALSADAVRVYLDMRKHLNFNCSNNGQLAYSHRQAADILHAAWRRGSNALAELVHCGFVVCRDVGAPGPNIRPASEWQLTAFECGGQEASKQFMRWDGTVFEPRCKGSLGAATRAKRDSEKQLPIGNMKTPRRQHEDAPYPQSARSESKTGKSVGNMKTLSANRRRQHEDTSISTTQGGSHRGRPTLRVRVAQKLHAYADEYTRAELMADFGVGAGEAQRVLGQLCEQGLLERVGHGRYRPTAANGGVH